MNYTQDISHSLALAAHAGTTTLTRDIDAATVEEAIGIAEEEWGDWREWEEETLGTNGIDEVRIGDEVVWSRETTP